MIAAIIQARMTSSRLPCKVMLPINGKPVLDIMIDRVKKAKKIDKIVVATTKNELDDIIVNLCQTKNIEYFRGSENDVLERFYETSKKFAVDIIVRLTSDTPLIDAKSIDDVIKLYENTNSDFTSNFFPFPRTFPDGYNVEVFSMKILERIHNEAKKPSDREHVTTYITMQPERFSIKRLDYKKDVSKFRLNLDYEKDYLFIKKVFENFSKNIESFSLEEILEWLENNPDIVKINADIKPYENIIKSFEDDSKCGFEPYKNNYYLKS
mgnify:CR=1 FL=1